MADYATLMALAPTRYLNPADPVFRMELDADGDTFEQAQYGKGLEEGRRALAAGGYLTIGERGTWGAVLPNPDSGHATIVTSYEGIGYHRATRSLLRGFLDSGAPIVVYRDGKGHRINGAGAQAVRS